MTTSCYCWSWRSLHRRTNAGIVGVSAPGDYALFNSNHIPDGTLALITIVNLRGTLEAGLVFCVPTYLFVASLGEVLLFGVIKAVVAGGSPVPVVPPPPLPAATETVT